MEKIAEELLVYGFQVEGERAEAVVAADHGAHGVFHPAVKEVALAVGKGFNKGFHGIPGGKAYSIRSLSIFRYPLLALPDIAGVLDGVLIFCHQVRIGCLADGCDFDFVHAWDYSVKIEIRLNSPRS